MRAFASFILRGRLQAILVAAVAAALTMVLPLFSHLAGGALALVTLRNGLREGAVIALGAALLLAAFGYLSTLDTRVVNIIIASMVMLIWFPALLTANVLRVTRSIDLALAVAGGIIAAGMLLFYLYVGDVVTWWHSALEELLLPLLQQIDIPIATEDRGMLIESMARVMTGVLAATTLFTTMINLFIGRWFQALLFNPGGLGPEFRGLRLGRPLGVVTVVVLAGASFAEGVIGNLALNLMFLIGAIYTLQGLALAHAVVMQTRAHNAWLIGLYVLMLFALPQVALALSAAGFADSWLDIRSKFTKKSGPPAPGNEGD